MAPLQNKRNVSCFISTKKEVNKNMKNKEKMKYTIAHRKAFRTVEKQLLGHNTFRSLFHDFDKMLLYPFLTKKRFQNGIEIIHAITKNTQKLIQILCRWLLIGNVHDTPNLINL